jgi:MYXO-CTERM domain-containing protein
MIMNRVKMAIAASILLASGAGRANLISYTLGAPEMSAPWNTTPTFTLFDPALGALNSVDLLLSTSSNASAQVQNMGNSGAQATINPLADVALYFNDATPITDTYVSGASASQYLPAFDSILGPSSASYMSVSGLTGSAILDTLLTDSTSLSYFAGIGSSYLYIVVADYSSINGLSAANGGVTNNISANIVVTLDYTPTVASSSPPIDVPEPAAAAVLLAGIGALLALRRPRRA